MTDRKNQLQKMLEREPNDTFLLYGLAMEHKKAGNSREALDLLRRVIELDGGYCYAWYQQGQIHEIDGDTTAARSAYEQGIAAAERVGDAHARDELQSALDALT